MLEALLGAAIGGIASGLGGFFGAKEQSKAANQAADLQRYMYDQTRQDQAPWRDAGMQALNQLIPLVSNYRPFTVANMYSDPGYQFRLSEGLKSIDRQAAARGGLISGAALKAAGRYGQDYASSEYQNSFNRYQVERNAQLNPLLSMAGMGQVSTNALGQAGQNYANQAGEAYMGAGNARAGGWVAGANALNNALSQYQNQSMMQQFLNRMGSTGYAPFTPSAGSGLGGNTMLDPTGPG